MQKILVVLFWLKFSLTTYPQLVDAQSLPFVACPEYFQYLRYGDQLIGKITLPDVELGLVKLDVQLSQRESIHTQYVGRVIPFDSLEETDRNLINGDPISYRVDFPFSNIAPKVTRIAVNGNVICSANGYPSPKTTVDLTHTFTPSTTIGRPRPRPTFVMDSRPVFHYEPIPSPTPAAPAPRPPSPRPTVARPPPPPPPTQPPPRPQTTAVQSSISQNVNEICGRENSVISPFIFGGTELERGQYPWLTAIYEKQTTGLRFICGGSLVNARSVVSAAHCFTHGIILTAKQVVAYLGRHNLEDYSEDGALAKDLQNLVIHPEYNKATYPDADIAILQLSTSVQFTQYISPICLWSGSTDIGGIEGQNGYVAGWGGDENGQAVSPIPKTVKTKVVSENVCLRSSPSYSKLLTKRSFCAGNRDNTGPCMGDSGGGLMISRGDRWLLRGIVSAGQTKQQMCDLHEYVVFCDLAQHLSWVRDNM